jgi:hypothetical protein
MALDSQPILQSLRVRTVRVPLQHPRQTASGAVVESLAMKDGMTEVSGAAGSGVAWNEDAVARFAA